MSALIPTSRPVIGEDLDALREQLGLSTMDACWLYGMSMTKWMNEVKKGARTPVSNVTLALLARQLSAHPTLCPLPQSPSAASVFESIGRHESGIDKKRFAILFGCEASSGYRWITVGSKISPVLSRLFLVFQTISLSFQSRGATDKHLREWERMVEREAQERGVVNIFSAGRWTPTPDTRMGRPVIGEDLDELREMLGLSTLDACWLFGMSMTKWMTVVKDGAREPVSNSTLALLVRALRQHPEACPIPRMVGAVEVYESVLQSRESLDKKRMAIMFGCEASSGYRWLTVGSKISPVLARLFTVFKQRHDDALRLGMDAADAVLTDWDRMVVAEASARDIPNVFSTGRWTRGASATSGTTEARAGENDDAPPSPQVNPEPAVVTEAS